MRYLLLILITLAGLSSAFAQTVGKQLEFNSALGIDYYSNLISNPSAYKNTLNVSGTCTVTRDTSSTYYIDKKASFSYSCTTGQYIEWTLLSPSVEQTQGNCEFKGKFQADTAGMEARILDGSSNVLASLALTAESSYRDFNNLIYPCAASGSRKVRIHNATAGTVTGHLGKMYYGSATGVTYAAPQSTYSAVVNSAGNVTALGGSQDWITGSCTISPTGTFTCPIKSGLFNVGPSCVATLQGSSSADQTVARVTATSLTSVVVNTTTGAGTGANIAFNLVCVKQGADSVQAAISPNNSAQYWNGNIAGNNWTNTATATFADFAAGSGISVTTYQSSGLSCSAISGSLPGLTCTNAIVGATYQICSAFSGYDSVSTNTILAALYDGAGNAISSGNGGDVSGVTKSLPFMLCGQLTASSTSFDVKIRGRQAVAGTFTLDNNSYPKHFSIIQIAPAGKYPILVGGITSNSNNALRMESVSFAGGSYTTACNSTPCTLYGSNTSWATVTRSGTGAYTINFTAAFNGIPDCTITMNAISGQAFALKSLPTTSSMVFNVYNISGSLADGGGTLICIGPR